MTQRKPILCLDFDGVIHSYDSGWQGPRNIPDSPVPGALEFILEATRLFEVHIFSSRSRYFGGRRAMKRWLTNHLKAQAREWRLTPHWLRSYISETSFADPWEDEVDFAIKKLVNRTVQWPQYKPPATVSIDDRCLTFTGKWPSPHELESFRPWNKKEEHQS